MREQKTFMKDTAIIIGGDDIVEKGMKGIRGDDDIGMSKESKVTEEKKSWGVQRCWWDPSWQNST